MATYKEIQAYVKDKYGFQPKMCWIAHMKEVCGIPVKNAPNRISPANCDYLIYPYYPAYTMGCYQIVISGDNGSADLLFVLEFVIYFITLLTIKSVNSCSPFLSNATLSSSLKSLKYLPSSTKEITSKGFPLCFLFEFGIEDSLSGESFISLVNVPSFVINAIPVK